MNVSFDKISLYIYLFIKENVPSKKKRQVKTSTAKKKIKFKIETIINKLTSIKRD